MNFILKPMERECFYEDFDGNSPVRTIDAFVQAGGNVAVLLTIHGPLELSDIRSVSKRFLIMTLNDYSGFIVLCCLVLSFLGTF